MRRPLFDVILHVEGEDETGTGIYSVEIVDRFHKRGDIIGHKSNLLSLDEAMAFAKGAVTEFMKGTEA